MKNTDQKKALITGITGQDGSYLAELLLEKGYEVHGVIRRSSVSNTERIEHIPLFLHYGDLTDGTSIERIIREVEPDEIYNLGAQSDVMASFDLPEYTANVDALGALRLFETVKNSKRPIKIYHASSSEMFGSAPPPQNETTPFHPRSPYGYSKVFAYHAALNYREAYGMFICNGILFNHESPRRGEMFVTRKITRGIADIKAGRANKLYLGNLEAKRDWGYAPEYCEAMWRMMQEAEPNDYVIATGETHSVREFLKEAFHVAGLGNFEPHVEIDQRYLRPTEVDLLKGDASKAREKLNWKPTVTFKELVKIMVEADMDLTIRV